MRTPTTSTGMTLWLTGLPGSGKSTLAQALARELGGSGFRTQVLDGDELRANLSADLGFTERDRNEHTRRVGFVAQLLAGHGVVVLVPVIAPYRRSRADVRAHHEQRGTPYVEVHVSTPVSECMQRDPKGLYAKAAAGRIPNLTGYNDTYEEPDSPDIRVDTTDIDLNGASELVMKLLAKRGLPVGS
ncbi:adenylyl-sulfate kinase [Saccharopolyspora griseoalba]|uniref:Adenylyl-sulfate kinase n=1 Tax=Saccharopolyspora griseoalba TaxID=1431848 RepID=A0ABW2LED7_9PSEU